MGNLVSSKKGKGKSVQITDADRAVLTLKAQRKKLTDQRARIDAQIAKEVDIARQLLRANKKERALLAMRRKKLQEKQLDNIDNFLVNVETLLLDIESAKRTSKIVDALKTGTAALKEAQATIPIEDVEKLLDETAEAKEHEEAIRKLLGESLDAEEEDAVLEELAALESQALENEIEAMPNVPETPEPAKTATPAAASTADTSAEADELPAAPAHQHSIKSPVESSQERVAELAS